MADSENAHLFFAKKLASNDLEMRTTTLKNLAAFFGKTGVLTETDLTKIWMGLWYAMWMSDKPAVQRELAESISKLVHTHNNIENAIMFIKTFYTTFHREFPKIDRLRHDKFLKFARIFVRHSLTFIKNKDYDSDVIEKYHSAVTFMWDMDDAQEIQLHVCDVFFEELYTACGNTVPSEAMFQFAGVFANALEKSTHTILKQRLFDALKAFIDAAGYCSPKLAPKDRKGLDNDKSLFPDVEFINVSVEEVEKWFMDRASRKGDFYNRDLFYKLHDHALKKLRSEPGFKLLPRGRIMKKIAETEEQEYQRLMEEYERSKGEEEKEEEERELNMSKKERKKEKKRKIAELKRAAREAKEKGEGKEEEGEGEEGKEKEGEGVEDITAAEEPGQKKKNKKNKNKKQKTDSAASSSPSPSPSTPATSSPKSTVTTTKQVKKNAKGDVVSKSEETKEIIVKEDGKTKVTEVITTTVQEVKKTTPVKKGEKKGEKEGGKGMPTEEASEVPKEVESEEKGGKKNNKKAQQKEAEEETPKQTKPKPKPTPTPAPTTPTTNGKESKKRKSSETETPSPVTPTTSANGKTSEKKRKVNGNEAKETNSEVPNGTPQTKGKKSKQQETQEEEEGSEGITPKSKGKKGKKGKKESEGTPAKNASVVSAPPSTGKKSVRFSNDNLIKEFDKSKAVTTSPSTSSPATTPVKLKSLLTPPSGKKK